MHLLRFYRLTEEQTRSLLIEPTSKKKDVISATEVGNRVGKFGDELERVRQQLGSDQDFTDFVENAVRDTNGTQAFEEFTGIANQVLEVGDSGLGKTFVHCVWVCVGGYVCCVNCLCVCCVCVCVFRTERPQHTYVHTTSMV